MNRKLTIGTLCAIGAAVCYGTNPLGALNLYAEGMNTPSVLFFRFGLAWIVIAAVMLLRRESILTTPRQLRTLAMLGLLFTLSSLSLYLSFHYMAAGIASTLLFTYPIMTAVIMALLYHQRIGIGTISAIALSLVGVALLYWGDQGGPLHPGGVVLVLISALTYALYIIVVDRSPLPMSSFKINFYVLLCCSIGMLLFALCSGQSITLPATPRAWFYVGWLAIVPAIMALVMMVYAARYLGSTPTAILGALEPLTAVLIGIFLFGEIITPLLALGIILILISVTITIIVRAKKALQ